MGWASSFRSKRKGTISFEKTVGYLEHTPFFQYLSTETTVEFAQCFPKILRFPPGKEITLDSERIYVVAEGEVDLSTTYPVEGSKVEAQGYLCRKRQGDIVNVHQTQQTVERAVSKKLKGFVENIITVGCGNDEILLLCGDMEALDKFSKTHPDLSEPFAAICNYEIEDRLLTIPFLANCPKLGVLAAMCRYEAYDSNQVVFEENSEAKKLFFVLSGVAKVVANALPSSSSGVSSPPSSPPSSPAPSVMRKLSERSVTLQRSLECSGEQTTLVGTDGITIAELKSGDYFGETALVFDIDRTCSVQTTEKCLFLTVHKTDFENFLKICPMDDSLREVITKRMVSKLSSLGIPFLSGIPDEMLSSLATSVVINEVPEDHVIFRQGDEGDKFYIVVHGSVRVETLTSNTESSDDEVEKSLGTLGPGQYFGEMALVNFSEQGLRSATVISTQKSILLSIDKESFHTIFGSNDQVSAEFELRVLKSSAELKHVLAHSLGATSFRNYLEKEHAGENIDFWLAVGEFIETMNESNENREEEGKEKAHQIFKVFCAEYADRQVNLPHKMLVEIEDKMNSGDKIAPDLFDGARDEIYRLMKKDKFSRYTSSQDYKDFLDRLGIL